jgi:predicted nucleic acid-binding Zn ribbon protein/Zn finger protein HypA/HybF involved in hydrogenase expression
MLKIKDRINDDVFIEVCKTSLTMAQAAKKLGIHFNSFKKRAIELNCYFTNPSGKGINKKSVFKQTLEEILVKNSPYRNTHKLKNRLIKEGLKEHRCENCNNTEWLGQPIPIELHHIDGDNSNNLLENLQILCPNCHSLTETFRSKNLKNRNIIETIDDIKDIKTPNIYIKKEKIKVERTVKKLNICKECGKETSNETFCSNECRNIFMNKNIPTKEQLLEDFKILKSNIQVGKKYNVTDNAVKKWLIKYNIKDIVEQFKTKSILPKEQLIEDYNILKSKAKMCQKYKIGKSTLKEWFKVYDI